MGMDQEQTPHKRRVRYKGKYPRKFEEKYKELQPEKYGDTIAHVIQKGNTPAGMHISIMVKEILDFLKIQPGETGFDATPVSYTHLDVYKRQQCSRAPGYHQQRRTGGNALREFRRTLLRGTGEGHHR